MKKSVLILSAITILGLTACNVTKPEEDTKKFDPTAVDSIVERKIGSYGLTATPKDASKENNDVDDYVVAATKSTTCKVYNINNENIPYVSVKDFVNSYIALGTLLPNLYGNYEYSFDGNVIKAINEVNNSYLEFDVFSQKVTYHGYSTFFSLTKQFKGYFPGAFYGSGVFDDALTSYEFYEGNETISYSLSDYSIKNYLHRGEVYIPYDTACNLFGQANYIVVYAGDRFYTYSSSADNSGLAINKYISEQGTEWINEEYLLSQYNNLALSLDMNVGIESRESRTEEGKVIKYLENGAYAALEPYKERLLSTEENVSNDALIDFFNNELDDGGHSMASYSNMLSSKNYKRIEKSGPEATNTLNQITAIQNARKEKGNAITDVLPDFKGANGYYKEYGETAYIQFDSFTRILSTKEQYKNADIDEKIYPNDTVSLFYYANEKIQSNKDIKNVVIDLAGNGGGELFAANYVASWVCGGSNSVFRNAKTKSLLNYRVEADVNFDGVFNEQDYLSPDINVYVMISSGSFSSGNKLPCTIKDNRTQNTYFIGSRSGGGCCGVGYSSMNYLGETLRLSSNMQLGRTSSTPDNFVSVESGIEADEQFKIADNDYAAFADIDSIINKIENK